MGIVFIILLASFFMTSSASIDKEGFITYVVYGPGYGGWGGPGGWPYGYRPYWAWRRPWIPWRGPCPGPWCPYY